MAHLVCQKYPGDAEGDKGALQESDDFVETLNFCLLIDLCKTYSQLDSKHLICNSASAACCEFMILDA